MVCNLEEEFLNYSLKIKVREVPNCFSRVLPVGNIWAERSVKSDLKTLVCFLRSLLYLKFESGANSSHGFRLTYSLERSRGEKYQ